MLTISRIGDSMAGLTETPAPVRFDPATLETLGAYRYRDDMVGQITTAHPQLDVPPPVRQGRRTPSGRFDGWRQCDLGRVPLAGRNVRVR